MSSRAMVRREKTPPKFTGGETPASVGQNKAAWLATETGSVQGKTSTTHDFRKIGVNPASGLKGNHRYIILPKKTACSGNDSGRKEDESSGSESSESDGSFDEECSNPFCGSSGSPGLPCANHDVCQGYYVG